MHKTFDFSVGKTSSYVPSISELITSSSTSHSFQERNVSVSDIAGTRHLHTLITEFLEQQELLTPIPDSFEPLIAIYPSARATFYAPSDICGVGGMRREFIRASSTWRKGVGRFDTVFIKLDNQERGMRGLGVARLQLLFSFRFLNTIYPCALINDFHVVGDQPDRNTGMWKVKRAVNHRNRRPILRVIHLASIIRAAHLIPVFKDTSPVADDETPDTTLDTHRRGLFYVNKYIDHHAFEIAF
jgi:hypothetical protein